MNRKRQNWFYICQCEGGVLYISLIHIERAVSIEARSDMVGHFQFGF